MSALEKAVEVLALHLWRKQFGSYHERAYEPYFQNARDMLTALRAADICIVSRADVEAAVALGESLYPNTFEFVQHFREAMGDGE